MKTGLGWRKIARQEMEEAFAWYEQQAAGLGWEFAQEVETSIQAILSQPHAYPLARPTIRKFVLRRFPYCLFYHGDKQRVVILAVFHAKRDPKQWSTRT